MKDFFKGVRRHIGKLDAEHLREQYARLSEETISLETLFKTIAQGIVDFTDLPAEGEEILVTVPLKRPTLGTAMGQLTLLVRG